MPAFHIRRLGNGTCGDKDANLAHSYSRRRDMAAMDSSRALGNDMPGLMIITFFCIVAAVLSFNSISAYGIGNAFGVATGAVAVVAMSQCLILAARPRRR